MNHFQDSFSLSTTALPSPSANPDRGALAVIDPRPLERDCFVRCIELARPDIPVAGFGSVADWRARKADGLPMVVLYSTGSRPVHEVADEIAQLVSVAGASPVVVIGTVNALSEMLAAFECGARGYLPASVGVDEIAEASLLASFRGIFLPLASLQALRDAVPATAATETAADDSLTDRQRAVCEALRRGKSNKIIAEELNLCESTVKVHIRNIMKKLGAKNRTEAAFKLNASMVAGGGRLS